ncbi:universal stress protein [Insolitispirillum peregrinum]|uniref:Nucleotide-binding universal stress protein, UspA family n=1 Tax=Insolitispirillum peregrinum TaxID=80876 RepID=A0A1N7K7P5_9PROT|nr:universal stress protein [Insolitispirillum peregrinum]SIS57603.1 Nucleotide-binding universal stress protein, UspA family [Insolitispirillum peregrinum]
MFSSRLPFTRKQHAELKANAPSHRRFLVVVDQSEELRAALRFAAMRARNTGGRVTLLAVVQLPEFQDWMFVGNLIQEESRLEAEHRLQSYAAQVHAFSGDMPELLIREGDTREELIRLLREDPRISVVVLASGSSSDGPGPLVTALTGKYADKLSVPVTIVPGHLSDEKIDAMT